MPESWKTKGEKGGTCSYTNGSSDVEQQPLTVPKSMQSPPRHAGDSGTLRETREIPFHRMAVRTGSVKLFGVPK